MIYIVQEFYKEKWWITDIYVTRFYANEKLAYLKEKGNGKYRIKEFEIPQE